MGSSCSVAENAMGESYTLWTPQEKAENARAVELQKVAGEYVAEFVFYGVPVKFGKKNVDPTSPIIFEIDTSIVDNYLADDNVRSP
jgi:hypothetical protein